MIRGNKSQTVRDSASASTQRERDRGVCGFVDRRQVEGGNDTHTVTGGQVERGDSRDGDIIILDAR